MVWNKDEPQGSRPLKTSDDEIRANNTAIENAKNLEHVFSTAGDQTGRHRFPIGDETARDAYDVTAAPVAGSVFYRTDLVPNDDPGSPKHVPQVYDGAAWLTDYPVYPDVPTERTKAEWGLYTQLTQGGIPSVVDWSWDDGNAFKLTLLDDATLNYPTGVAPAALDRYQPIVLEVTQGGAGNFTLAFQAAAPGFVAAFGGQALAISPTAASRSLLSFQLLPDRSILVTVLPDLQALT